MRMVAVQRLIDAARALDAIPQNAGSEVVIRPEGLMLHVRLRDGRTDRRVGLDYVVPWLHITEANVDVLAYQVARAIERATSAMRQAEREASR